MKLDGIFHSASFFKYGSMKNSTSIINKEFVERYFNGIAASEEEKTVRQWFDEIQLKDKLCLSTSNTWESIPLEMDIPDLDGARILDSIHHKLNREESMFIGKGNRRSIFLRYLSRAAAILVLPLLLSTYILYQKIHSIYSETSYSGIYAPPGTRTTFHLPDGTEGWINGGSRIKFPVRFHGKVRRIELTGEAYLNVTQDLRKPFLVSTRNIEVKVYGTRFNVMAYPEDIKTEVTLESGLVEVFWKNGETARPIGRLKPDQSLIYFHESGFSNLNSVHSQDKTAWIDGKLVFRYEPFYEVIQKINRWYNVNIVIKDSELKNHSYYGTFRNETLEEVLKLLKLTAPIRYKDLGREKLPDGTYEKRMIELYYKK